MNSRCLQFIFATFFVFLSNARGDLEYGKVYQITLSDIEGRQFSLTEGRATLLTIATKETEPKAHVVGHNVPDEYVGHSHYRCVTVINFQNRIPAFLRGILAAVVRNQFRAEADSVQPRYTAKQIEHSPRLDLFAIADFDGAAVRQLGMDPASSDFAVFVFDGHGALIREWHDVPSREELGAALAAAKD
jgi:hypothetical protein